MKAYFTQEGRLICTASGEMDAPEHASFTAEIADGTHANDIHYDVALQTVVERATVALSVVRSTVAFDAPDAIPISGLEGVVKLSINGTETDVQGSFDFTATEAGVHLIEAAGAHRSQPLIVTAVSRGEIEATLHSQIDTQAGETRKRFITEVPGQEMTYMRKETEARAYVAAHGPKAADYPLLSAEASVKEVALLDLANTVIANANAWSVVGAQIEALRIGAKDAVSKAKTVQQMFDAANVEWPSAGQAPA